MVHLIQKIVVVCKTLNCHKKKNFASGVPADAVPEAGAGQLHLLHGEPGLRSRANSCQGELQVFKLELEL